MATELATRQFLLLLEPADAELAAEAIHAHSRPGSVDVLRPPVTGVAFFAAAGDDAVRVDEWWLSIPAGAGRAVVLIAHEPGLPQWLPGLDADLFVAVPDDDAARLYAGMTHVRCRVCDDAGELASATLTAYGLAEVGADANPPAPVDPFELLAQAEPVTPTAAAVPVSRRELLGAPSSTAGSQQPPTSGRLRQLLGRVSMRRPSPVDPDLGRAVLARKPVVIAVVSRKGGVGKTASAAAIAAILGEALDPLGHTAALVDANIGNPDAWGRLDVHGEAATVRETMARLAAGEEPKSPAWSRTPALAVYPESRVIGDGYTPAEIQRLAAYLRVRHAAIVVDLPNRLPSFASAEASVAAAWIEESGAVVVPTTADPAALLGVLEYVETESVRRRPVVVPYIVPRLREIRQAPEVVQLVDRIRTHVRAVVEVPDDDRATLALIRRTAITEVGGRLRDSYKELSGLVVDSVAVDETRR